MTVTVNDNPTSVIVSQNGAKGDVGTNGTNGTGFNNIRKNLIDSPLTFLYKQNNIVNTLKNVLYVDRVVAGTFDNIYGVNTAGVVDTPREEVEGWLLTSDETHTFDVYDNVPLLNSGFSCVLAIGAYSGGSVSQDIINIPATSGDLLTIGTDALNQWRASIQGSDLVTYNATTTTAVSAEVCIITYLAGVLNLYLDGVLAGTATIATGLTTTLDTTGSVTLNGDYTLNIAEFRIYDFVLNADEITYLSGA